MEDTTAKKSNHGANVRRWSGYEKRISKFVGLVISELKKK